MIVKDDYYCISCLQHRESKHFSEWIEDTSKARKCNDCMQGKSERVDRILTERKNKPKSNLMRTLVEKEQGRKRHEIRDTIESIAEQKRIEDEIGL